MPKNENLKPAKSTNPKWLETARLFYADSFASTRKREIRGPKDDWADLTEEEQSFALAHLQYIDLMAQAGTQRLLVQIRDLLEEIAEGLAVDRSAVNDATGDDDNEEDDDQGSEGDDFDEQGEPVPGFEPPAQLPPVFSHPVPRGEPVTVVQPGRASESSDDGGGRAA